MHKTTKESLIRHFREDLGLKSGDMVFLHSGLRGLGFLQGGLDTLTEAFLEVLGDGVLVCPAFSYSWSRGEPFDPASTACPGMGVYAEHVWQSPRFARTRDPNFSVSLSLAPGNRDLVERLSDISSSCLGEGSVFDNMYRESAQRDGYILLLGGAHDDVVFRTTFVHYAEELKGAPYRFRKRFHAPDGDGYVDQLVRFFSEEEYRAERGGEPPSHYSFPIGAKYARLGEDLQEQPWFRQVPFAYSVSRMAALRPFCSMLMEKIGADPDYLLK